jgi:hypothetical protein
MTELEKPTMSLNALLQALTDADEAGATVFDPAQIVGDLRDKVDAIHHVLTRLKSQETWAREMAKPFQKAAQSLARNYDNLRDYVSFSMKENNFESLPGNQFKVRRRDSQPALQMLKDEPSVLDYQAFPDYVEPVRGYRWKPTAIKDALVAGKLRFDDETQAFAKLTFGIWPEFVPNTPDKIQNKKKKVKNEPATTP